MTDHVAIVTAPYDRLILDGRKRIESRCTQTARAPFGCAVPGDRIFFKRSGGPFFAVATMSRVLMADQLTPPLVDQLVKQYNRWIGGTDEYWQAKRLTTKFITLMWLRDVQPISAGPSYKPENMRAWYVLDQPFEVAPAAEGFTVTLTDGAIRQHYVRPPKGSLPTDVTVFELHLPDGPTITTDLVRGMFRWRGWKPWFAHHHLRPGDRLQFILRRRGVYDVRPSP